MKKLLTAFAITVLSATATFANTTAPTETTVNEKVLKTFKTEFTTASSVTWSQLKGQSIFRASFTNNQQECEAFISEDGDLIATARTIDKKQLSMDISSSLEKAYGKSYIDNNVVELSIDGSTSYYVTVITEKATLIVKASTEGDLSVFKKQRGVAA